MVRAEIAEAAMWEFVSGVLKDPRWIHVGMDTLIEHKRAEMRGDPEGVAKAWLERIAEVDQERRGYLRLAAKGRITDAELDEAFAELEETRQAAEQELEAIRGRWQEVEERDRDALLASWSSAVPANLDKLTSEKRNALYHTLRLELKPCEEGYEVTAPFCSLEPLF